MLLNHKFSSRNSWWYLAFVVFPFLPLNCCRCCFEFWVFLVLVLNVRRRDGRIYFWSRDTTFLFLCIVTWLLGTIGFSWCVGFQYFWFFIIFRGLAADRFLHWELSVLRWGFCFTVKVFCCTLGEGRFLSRVSRVVIFGISVWTVVSYIFLLIVWNYIYYNFNRCYKNDQFLWILVVV